MVGRLCRETMMHRIEMDIIQVPGKIRIVSDHMVVIASLPEGIVEVPFPFQRKSHIAFKGMHHLIEPAVSCPEKQVPVVGKDDVTSHTERVNFFHPAKDSESHAHCTLVVKNGNAFGGHDRKEHHRIRNPVTFVLRAHLVSFSTPAWGIAFIKKESGRETRPTPGQVYISSL